MCSSARCWPEFGLEKPVDVTGSRSACVTRENLWCLGRSVPRERRSIFEKAEGDLGKQGLVALFLVTGEGSLCWKAPTSLSGGWPGCGTIEGHTCCSKHFGTVPAVFPRGS